MLCWAHFTCVLATTSNSADPGRQGSSPGWQERNKLLGKHSLLEQHVSSYTQSWEGCIHSCDSGMLRMALYVNGDFFKQQICYYQLLTGNSQRSNFIILRHIVELTSWNTLQFLFWNEKPRLHFWGASSINPTAKTWIFGGLNLAVL